MRIIVIGVVAFVIWCFFSAWLYNDILRPVLPGMRNPVPVPATPESMTNVADSLMKLKASMPKDLLIYFEFNDAKFKPDPQSSNSIAPFKTWLDQHPGSMLLITGHTDLVGTPDYNRELGMKRARIVSEYLVSQGINASRIQTESLGETKPIGGYITQDERAKNRRTEITIKLQ